MQLMVFNARPLTQHNETPQTIENTEQGIVQNNEIPSVWKGIVKLSGPVNTVHTQTHRHTQ